MLLTKRNQQYKTKINQQTTIHAFLIEGLIFAKGFGNRRCRKINISLMRRAAKNHAIRIHFVLVSLSKSMNTDMQTSVIG